MNRNIWIQQKQIDSIYTCPNCNSGILKLYLINKEITESGRFYEKQNNYPNGIEHLFSAILKCNTCNEITTTIGRIIEDNQEYKEMEDGSYEVEYVNYYEPKFFFPNLKIFPLDDKIPRLVREQIDLSFANFFHDSSSCANRVRNAIELILDDIKVDGRILGNRIKKAVEIDKVDKEIGELLLAIKHVGNQGSHGVLETSDILDIYQILHELLDRLYIKDRINVLDIANQINSIGKPRTKK